MLNLVRPHGYKIEVTPTTDGKHTLLYIEYFDKENELHVDAFKNTQKYLDNINVSLGKDTSIDINEEDVSVRLVFTSDFETIADAIAGEFLAFSRLGNMTFLNLISMLARNKYLGENHVCQIQRPIQIAQANNK